MPRKSWAEFCCFFKLKWDFLWLNNIIFESLGWGTVITLLCRRNYVIICSYFWSIELQLCVWSIDGWEKKKTRVIPAPAGRQAPLVGETKVQFHNDQAHVLVVHESQIAIYDSKLQCSRSVNFSPYCPWFVLPH